jgi:hypothetical protein
MHIAALQYFTHGTLLPGKIGAGYSMLGSSRDRSQHDEFISHR